MKIQTIIVLLVAVAQLGAVEVAEVRVHETTVANPIRKVVTMLQMMQNKVTAEGEKEEKLMEKFMCYCKNGVATLEKSIEDAKTKIPQLEADIKEAEAAKGQLLQDVEDAKKSRAEAKEAIQKATAIRD